MLLITRAPLRLLLSGGGGQSASYSERDEGTFLMATLGYHTYSLITPGSAHGIRLISADYSCACDLPAHEPIEANAAFNVAVAAINYLNLCDGITITLASQLPPYASLGAPNAIATVLIKGLAFWSGLDLGAAEVADLVGNIEEFQALPQVTQQDAYGIALGGLNVVRRVHGRIQLEPFVLPPAIEATLEASLMLFLTPQGPLATIPATQWMRTRHGGASPAELLQINAQIEKALLQGDIESYGQWLHRVRLMQQPSPDTPDTLLERGYRLALTLGAWGGTISDEGGRGTLTLVCPPRSQEDVSEVLTRMGLIHRPITLTHEGVELFQTTPWPPLQTWRELYVSRRSVPVQQQDVK